MEINNKDIWQFGNQHIDANTGKPATKEEIAIFNKQFGTTEERKEFAESSKRERQDADKKWHLKYDSLVQKFRELDDEELESYVAGMNDEHLCYDLATALFDNEDVLGKIKEIFPDHWEKALKWYKDGYHDT